MDKMRVIRKLKADYPEANIVSIPEDNPTEIVCEIDPANGKAIAIIDRSVSHLHHQMKEHYLVLQGFLHVFIDGKYHLLSKGDSIDILPEQVHYAIGEETWIEVTSTPPWSPEDHIIVPRK